MRDLLSYDPKETRDVEPGPRPDRADDPVARARAHARTDLPKRFYTAVTTDPVDPSAGGGWRILLDGRPVRTPAKRLLALPTGALAAAVAAEWEAQGPAIDPRTMPHTRLANAVVDGVADRANEVRADALEYAESDLVCYRATTPDRLVDRQAAFWDPVLDWAEEVHGARFLVAEGVVHVRQDPEAVAAVGRAIAGLDVWRLGAVHSLTTLTGSVLIALAILEGRLEPDAAWSAAMVDEDWNMELWGRDEEAVLRLEARRMEFDAAVAFARG